jgi:hypothetical protein
MLADFLVRGLLAFLLTFAWVGGAFCQSKSADLPVPQRIQCKPIWIGPAGTSEESPALLSQTITDAIQSTRGEFLLADVRDWLAWQFPLLDGNEMRTPVDRLLWVATGPLGGIVELFR